MSSAHQKLQGAITRLLSTNAKVGKLFGLKLEHFKLAHKLLRQLMKLDAVGRELVEQQFALAWKGGYARGAAKGDGDKAKDNFIAQSFQHRVWSAIRRHWFPRAVYE